VVIQASSLNTLTQSSLVITEQTQSIVSNITTMTLLGPNERANNHCAPYNWPLTSTMFTGGGVTDTAVRWSSHTAPSPLLACAEASCTTVQQPAEVSLSVTRHCSSSHSVHHPAVPPVLPWQQVMATMCQVTVTQIYPIQETSPCH
jgi:hypothetical protein